MHIYDKNLNYTEEIPYNLELILETYPQYQSGHYFSENFIQYPKLDNDVLVEKTKYDLHLDGIYQLAEGEKVENESIILVPKPSELLKPVWVNFEWVEGATLEEVEEHNFNESINFYNSELEFASKATAELSCEIITNEQFEEVKVYMQAIDPYRPQTFSMVARPEIFNKYK